MPTHVAHRDSEPGRNARRVRAAGFSDGDIVAIAGLIAQFLFTNIMNNIAQAELDFPAVEPAQA
jgi:hypothetical protein